MSKSKKKGSQEEGWVQLSILQNTFQEEDGIGCHQSKLVEDTVNESLSGQK